MEKALRPSLTSPKVTGRQPLPKKRRSILHAKGTTHQGMTTIDRLKKLSKAAPNGSVRGVDASLHPTRPLSDTNALMQKE
jgi:hypothetical protein